MLYDFEQGIEKRLVTGAVLIPDRPDSDGDTVSAEEIERLWIDFNENYANVDLEHTFNNVASVIGSSILEEAKTVDVFGQKVELPVGTWVMTAKVTDDSAWEDVKSGKLRGFSVTAVADTDQSAEDFSLEDLTKKSTAGERITFKDLGRIKVVTVSLVANPAVESAVFYAVKSKTEGGLRDKLNDLLLSIKTFLSLDLSSLDIVNKVEGETEMNPEEILAQIMEALEPRLAELETRVLSIEETIAETAVVEAEEVVVEDAEDVAAKDAEENAELVAIKSAIEALSGKVEGLNGLVTSSKSKAVETDNAGTEQSLRALLGLK